MRLASICIASFGLSLIGLGLLPQHPQPAALTAPPVAVCDATCHAQGIALLNREVATKAAGIERGRHCWTRTPAGVIPRALIVRGATLGTMNVRAESFDTAWHQNHDTGTANDVLVIAVCR